MRAAVILLGGAIFSIGLLAEEPPVSGAATSSPAANDAKASVEDPFARAFAALDEAEKTARAKARDDLLDELASALGRDQFTSDEFLAIVQQRDEFLKSVNSRTAPADLHAARHQYDLKLRSLLGEARFAKYRDFEATKWFRDEAGRIAQFGGAALPNWDAASREKLIRLLVKHAIPIEQTWMPLVPAIDNLKALDAAPEPIADRLSRLDKAFAALHADDDFKSLPAGIVTSTLNYFQTRLDGLRLQAMTPAEREARRQANQARHQADMQRLRIQMEMEMFQRGVLRPFPRGIPPFQPKLPTYY